MEDGIAIGTILAERYEVLEQLGSGGMGTVYKARHNLIGNIVAIKVMHPHLLKDAASQERFKSEARAAINLRHERLMAVSDYGLTDSGQPFLVMEFVQGKGLDTLLEEQKCLKTDEFFEIFQQVCDGLAHMHEKGIVHRDIKPSNIMLTRTNHDKWLVHIVDFGIAKVLPNGQGAVQQLTQTGEIFGSPLYMSPEQCKGREVDARSDIYSLGCVMFESLTGSPPHQGESAIETLMLHVNEKAPRLKDRRADLVDGAELDKIVACSLNNSPDFRYQTMNKLKDDLQQRKFSGPPDLAQLAGSASSSTQASDQSPLAAIERTRTPITFMNTFLSPLLIIAAAAATVWLTNAFGITQPRVVITGSTKEQNLREAELEFQLAREKALQGFIPEAAEYSQKSLDLRLKDAPGTLALAQSMNQRADIALHDAQHEALMLKNNASSGEKQIADRGKRISDDYSSAETLLKSAIAIADQKTTGTQKAAEPVVFRSNLVTAYLDQGKYQDAESTLNEISQLYLGHQEPDKADPEAVQRNFHDLFDPQYERLYWGTNREAEAAEIRLAHHSADSKYDSAAQIEDSAHPFSGAWSAGTFSLNLKQEGNALSGVNEISSLGFDQGSAHKNTVSGTVDGTVARLTCRSLTDRGQQISAVAVRVGNVLVFHVNHLGGDLEEGYVPDNAILSAAPDQAAGTSSANESTGDSSQSGGEASTESTGGSPTTPRVKPNGESNSTSEKGSFSSTAVES